MAKVGEGDPRWIVQERQDGRNVNSWHWDEKNITQWAKDHLQKLFTQQKVYDDSSSSIRILKIDKTEGDAVINVRKGKLLFVYDLEVTAKLEGTVRVADKDHTVHGQFDFNFNTEDNDDFDVAVKLDSGANDKAEDFVRTICRKQGVQVIRTRVTQFVKDMKELYGQQSSPTVGQKGGAASSATPSSPSTGASSSSSAVAAVPARTAASVKVKSLTINVDVGAPPAEVYNTVLDSGKTSAITQSAATIVKEVGGSFSMFGGAVTGQMVLLEPPSKILQKWRHSGWPAGHFSTVMLEFVQNGPHATKLRLTQTDIPEEDLERTEGGWRNLYFDRMRMLYGQVSIDSGGF
jgi:activator of HSP90 ATPase